MTLHTTTHSGLGRGLRALLIGAAVALVAVASGCGGSDANATGDGGTATTREDAELAFARCLREHGLEVSDPGAATGGGVRIAIRPGNETRFAQAQKECRKRVPGAFKEPSAEERQRFQDAALKFARCMRSHGVNVPDPKPGKDGFLVVGAGPGQGRTDSPRFKKAEKTCQALLPRIGGEDE